MGTDRIEKDPLFWRSDDHHEDGLVFNIPAKVKADSEDDTIVSMDQGELDHIDVERDKRKIRRKNQELLIIETRKQRFEINLIRKDLKPFLIAASVFRWIWKRIILVAIALVAVGALSAWLGGFFEGSSHENHDHDNDSIESE